MNEVHFPYPHNEDPDIFREALSYSEGATGFTASLIERDYYCSLILHHIFERETQLVFKGGTCLSKVYAEKVRAALTRREPAIRDLFDLFHAVRKMKLDLDAHDFLILVKQKLDVPGNIPVDISMEYKRELVRQLEGQLRPVLRPADFDSFNIDEAFEMIIRIAGVVSVWQR